MRLRAAPGAARKACIRESSSTGGLIAMQALAEPAEARASPMQTQLGVRRIEELERELHRKEKALA